MIEHPNPHYPHNKPYMQEAQNQASSSPKPSRQPLPDEPTNLSPSAMTASALADRVQDLEEQLILLANTLNEEGRQNQSWQQQLSNQNMQLRAELNDREEQIAVLSEKLKYSEEQSKLLKDNLFKQNEQMQVLHRELQQSRLHVSKIERTNGSQLEEKVLELNDEISTLLVKIQQLIEENNQQTTYIEDLERAIKQFKTAHQSMQAQIEKLTDENHYLKQEIKEVENLSMSQQKDVQNKLLHELDSTKEQLQQLRKAFEEREKKDIPISADKKQQNVNLYAQNEKELNSLRSEVHSLQEEIIQKREIERSLRKKYEERLRRAEDQASSLSEQLLKLKHKNRQLQNQCADHTFALEQLRKEKTREQSRVIKASDIDHYQGIITRLEEEKERMKIRIHKLESFQYHQQSPDYYTALLNESEAKVSVLREQLSFAEEELSKSKRSSREAAQLAKHWQQDYRRLSQEYEEVLRSRSNFEDKMRRDQAELARHKEIYEQLVRKYDNFQGMYKQLQTQVRLLEQQKGRQNLYDKQATELIKIQNSALKQEVSQLKHRVQELSYQILEKTERPDRFLLNEIQRYKAREKELERLLEDMRVRLSHSETNADPRALRELSDQLQRVNRMLNQKQMELDSMKEKYEDLHSQFNKKDISNVLPKHHPQLTRLKAQYVAAQRKLMENELAAKNAIQNSQYEMQALKIENAHHRKKIDELLRELTSQRTTTDYRNLLHSLQLAESRNRELERQIQHCQIKIKDFHDQLRRPRSRSRRGSDLRPSQSESTLIINQITPRQQIKPEQRQKSSQINKLKQEKGQGFGSSLEKENGYSSVYQQLMKQRQELRVARSQFENKWGSLSIGSHVLQNQPAAKRVQERTAI